MALLNADIIENGWREKLPLEDDAAVHEATVERGGNKHTRALEAGANFVKWRNVLRVVNGKLWAYDDVRGCFNSVKDPVAFVYQNFDEETRAAATNKDFEDISKRIFYDEQLEADYAEFNADERVINFVNGSYDLREGLLEHSPEYGFTYAIRAKFIEDGFYYHPEFDRFCETSLSDDPAKKKLALQILGYVLSDSVSGKCAIFLHGVSNGGKSVFLDLLVELLGVSNVSHVPLHKLGSDFAAAELFGKKANIAGEVKGKKLPDISVFKGLTGGDRINANVKHHGDVSFATRAKLVFAGNCLPQFSESDTSDAFANRLVVLLFNRSVPKEEQDPELRRKLCEERDAIASHAAIEYKNWLANGRVWAMPQESLEFINGYKGTKTTVESFLEDCCVFDSAARVYSAALYAAFVEWCSLNGYEALGKNHFREEILGKTGITTGKWRSGCENRHGFIGIGFATEQWNRGTSA